VRASSIVAALLVAVISNACESTSAPWSPAPSSAASLTSAIPFVIDSDVNGSEYVLTSLDIATGELVFSGSNGVVTAVLSTSTVFRDAQTAKYAPVDPCRPLAENYNTAGSTSDQGGVFSAIQAMATQGCHARILIEKNTVPPNPTKSFRPLASF
jgi:hypothetical protein